MPPRRAIRGEFVHGALEAFLTAISNGSGLFERGCGWRAHGRAPSESQESESPTAPSWGTQLCQCTGVKTFPELLVSQLTQSLTAHYNAATNQQVRVTSLLQWRIYRRGWYTVLDELAGHRRVPQSGTARGVHAEEQL
jgi:hypothetical protein